MATVHSTRPEAPSKGDSPQLPAVVIFGPPWPRSGTARVMENQIRYYRLHGFFTVFVSVPFFWYSMYDAENPTALIAGMSELGADRTLVANLRRKRYKAAKYKATFRHALRGTALDWIVAIGMAAQLADEEINFLRKLQAPLFHVNHVYTLGFALALRRRLYGSKFRPPILLETHDVQSQFLYQKKERNPWTRKPDSLERLMKSETALLEKVDALIHVSADDLELFQSRLPSKPHFLVFPTINSSLGETLNGQTAETPSIDLLFLGQWHPANLYAMKWFFEFVWPLISDRGYSLKILGQIGALVQRELPEIHRNFSSCFAGEVADVAPYYRAARCIIAPMVSGTGISIKTIEALALGKPFVGTSKAFRGMPLEPLKAAGIKAYDEPQAFADGIVQTLANQQEAGALSRAAYEKLFSDRAAYRARGEAVKAAMAAGQSVLLQSRLVPNNP
jgi:polysaccharide biosynthesis protein PslH